MSAHRANADLAAVRDHKSDMIQNGHRSWIIVRSYTVEEGYAQTWVPTRHRLGKTHERSCLAVISIRSLLIRAPSPQDDGRFKICEVWFSTPCRMKRCPAAHTLVENATMTIALATCILHSSELVMEVCQSEIFTCAVTGHHCSRRRNNHQSQRGKDDANQFQSSLVCHRKASLQGRGRKPGRCSNSGLPSLS
jgi:hypothetical protein